MLVSVVEVQGSFENCFGPSDTSGHTVVWIRRAVLHTLGLANASMVVVAGLVDCGVFLSCGAGLGVGSVCEIGILVILFLRSGTNTLNYMASRPAKGRFTWQCFWAAPPQLRR
jgi:hypothetical protein